MKEEIPNELKFPGTEPKFSSRKPTIYPVSAKEGFHK